MNAPLRVLIVDDEPLARRGLVLRLAGFDEVEIVGECGDGLSALAQIQALKPDLVFLDVQMPGLDGFGVIAQLPLAGAPEIVFVTAFDHYALRAFETSALDYLLKPVDEMRLHETLRRVLRERDLRARDAHCAHLLTLLARLSGRPELSLAEALDEGAADSVARADRLVVRDGARLLRLAFVSIRWIDAAGDYMCIHTDSETHVLRSTLQLIEQKLDPLVFVRVHRSTIVNARRVVERRPHANGEAFLKLDCGHEIKLSRSYRERFR
jgi:two-component system, LytTR family, response regulator